MSTPVSIAPELEVEALLRAGFNKLKSDPTVIRSLLARYQKAEIDEAVQYMEEHEVEIRLGTLPTPDGTMMKVPLIVVGWGGDEEDPQRDFIGDFAQYEDYSSEEWDQTLPTRHYQGVMMRTTLHIAIYGKDARHATFLYRMAMALMILGAMTLEEAGILNRTLGGGQPLQIEQRLFPEYTVGKLLTLRCDHTFLVGVDEALMGELKVIVSAVAGESTVRLR